MPHAQNKSLLSGDSSGLKLSFVHPVTTFLTILNPADSLYKDVSFLHVIIPGFV